MNQSNQNYWFVLREDEHNVLLSSNSFTAPQAGETKYIVDTGSKQYIEITEPQVEIPEDGNILIETTEPCVKRQNTFWDKTKVKLLLDLISIRYKNFNPSTDKFIFKDIAPLIGTTPEECHKKFMKLKVSFIRAYKTKLKGKETKWFYYDICEEAFNKSKFISPELLEGWDEQKIKQLLAMYIDVMEKYNENESMDIWKEIADALGTSKCSAFRKFRSLKRNYVNLLRSNRETGKVMKWPYYAYFQKIFKDYDLHKWCRTKTKLLLDAYAERIHMFTNSNYAKKELWRNISAVVGESPDDCDRKFRNLKTTYLRLKNKTHLSHRRSKWRYFKFFEQYISGTLNFTNRNYKTDNYVQQMLTFCIENREKFKNPLAKKQHLWRIIGSKLNIPAGECDKKFRNLKQTYTRLKDQFRRTGKVTEWPYYNYFSLIFDDDDETLLDKQNNPNIHVEDIMLQEINKIVDDVQERRQNNGRFERLIRVAEESNNIQRERNMILLGLLERSRGNQL